MAKRTNAWDNYTPEQKAARVAAMMEARKRNRNSAPHNGPQTPTRTIELPVIEEIAEHNFKELAQLIVAVWKAL